MTAASSPSRCLSSFLPPSTSESCLWTAGTLDPPPMSSTAASASTSTPVLSSRSLRGCTAFWISPSIRPSNSSLVIFSLRSSSS